MSKYQNIRVVVEYMQIAFVPKCIILNNQPYSLKPREILWSWEVVQLEWPFVRSLDDLMNNEKLYRNA